MPSKEELKRLQDLLKSNAAEQKNFVTSNAVENILAVPKREVGGVDWLKKPHFGEVPPYLQKIKQEITDEYEYIKSMQQQQAEEVRKSWCGVVWCGVARRGVVWHIKYIG